MEVSYQGENIVRTNFFRLSTVGFVVALLAVASFGTANSSLAQATMSATESANWTVFASGLDSPRGLKFGPDGTLYVAEGGTGGTSTTTDKDCTQVPDPIGPYTGGMTGHISKISPDGKRTIIADGL